MKKQEDPGWQKPAWIFLRLRRVMGISVVSTSMLVALQLQAQTSDPPEHAQTESILERARQYGEAYISRLPDFLCVQTTEQYEGDKKGGRWKQGDTITSKLVFAEGREKKTLQAINGRAPAPGFWRSGRRPLSTEGEFGILISRVLGGESAAQFTWSRWEDANGKRLAVFHYKVDREHSTMKLTLSDLAKAVVAYEGDLAADTETGAVWRISSGTNEIPPQLDMRSIATIVNYGPVTIGTLEYLLPSRASVEVATRSGRIRNDLTFRSYQKFETGSTITFGPETDTPAKPPH